ncbi:hypothetical protein DFP91_2413 [Pseudorhodoplanes sinuspersici]|nr:hypothetical protein DFP91_2413 [Pseudorhodoplanes sinuspersici]
MMMIQNGGIGPFRMEHGPADKQLQNNDNLAGTPGFELDTFLLQKSPLKLRQKIASK